MLTISKARDEDFTAAQRLVEDCHLPLDGLRECWRDAYVARIDGKIVGFAALENFGERGLLRSVAVSSKARRGGFGRKLVDAILADARQSGMQEIYLLTQTAADFFARFYQFESIFRNEMPGDVQRSVESVSACPVSAQSMRLALVQG